MSRKKRLGALLTAAVMTTSLWLTPVSAGEQEDLENELAILQQRAYEAQRRSEIAAQEMENVAAEIQVIDDEVAVASDDYRRVKKLLDVTEGNIEATEAELAEKTELLKERVAVLKKRVRDIYMHGQISYIDVLFGAEDFRDLSTRMDLWKRIIKQDYELVKSIVAQRTAVIEAKEKLETERRHQKQLVDVAEKREANILERRGRKQAIMDKLESEREAADRAYEENLAASREVENLIRQKLRGSSGSPSEVGPGGMSWPLIGEITSQYGWRVHPIWGDSRYHSGMDIAGDYGDEIRAAAAGEVIHSGWISGYGYAVIIDHGGSLTTLYGHNEALNVGVGQHVERGDVIAYCGSTGNSTGPHCHFEVRIDGELTDPEEYLP
ncbi:MAG: peptidoglycan DD-metalloendopeptidase family protein [Selenomonadaceae bacterium]|nr:peptidoglycan DD-metalloendopeptidase family protein [Selenomonadaceae bacterium]